MCDCIQQIEKEVLEQLGKDNPYKKRIVSVKLSNTGFIIDEKEMKIVGRRIIGQLKIELEGQKKQQTMGYGFKYCPICGKPYEDQ